MTIEIHNEELERLLQERLAAGPFSNLEELLLDALRHDDEGAAAADGVSGDSLVSFFRRSPLVGLELDLERDQDTGRDVSL
jgi:hypothetical protein